MNTNEFSFILPASLIAQFPASPRDSCRLMVADKSTGRIEHRRFSDLPDLLRPDDVLVFNDSKVFKARLAGTKETGGKAEVLLLRPMNDNAWEALIGARGITAGAIISFAGSLSCETAERTGNIWQVIFNKRGAELESVIDAIGAVPLPPYIKQQSRLSQYQTVYAKHRGSVAAPTAGLHVTKRLMDRLKKKGVQIEYLTLHVGLGTFSPIKSKRIEDHHIHTEWASINKKTALRLNKAKQEGRRIIAVGTTAARTLEAFCNSHSFSRKGPRDGNNPPSRGDQTTTPLPPPRRGEGILGHGQKEIDLYITPGYGFKFTDAMITNFHLPQSSLLVLVCAFGGKDNMLNAYRKAVQNEYRFFSFGDAMFIR